MEEKMISVIVPVYKVEPFLYRCVDSILNQTYQNIEVILVDDGSPDKCPAICDEYAKKDGRVRVVHKENGGLSSARNAGLDIAQGEYIAFVDSDDWIDEDMYRSMLELALKHNADIVQTEYRFFRPWKTENKVLDCSNSGKVDIYSSSSALQMLYFGPQMFDGLAIMVWTKIYKATLMKSLRFAEGYIHEDVEFTPRALYYANKVVKLNRSFYNYNIHLGADSTSGMKLTPYKVRSGVTMRRKVAEFFREHTVEKVSKYTLSAYYGSLLNAYFECRAHRNKSQEFKEDGEAYLHTIRESKQEILQTNPGWKTRLFFVSPAAYCLAVWTKREYKRIKYKLHVLMTGKN